MRCVAVAVVVAVLFSGSAHAEKRMFVIANNADDYGVDRCLISSGGCGTAVANAYCHSHEYARALSFRKVERDDIAGTTSASGADSCSGDRCGTFVAIECSR
jgi:hypothetical protein